MRLIAICFVLVVTGCAGPTIKQFKENKPSETWIVQLPIDQVYRDYKEYSEEKYQTSMFMGGMRVNGDFYGVNEGAGLSIVLEGTMMGAGPYLHFEFKYQQGTTSVTGWAVNSFWASVYADYKDLHNR